jgi:flagellar hook-associated protein 3 FlgL
MINRVTHQTIQTSTLANLQLNLTKMAKLQAQMSSGQQINKPSDDPAGTSDFLRLRGDQRATEQYSRNVDNGSSWMTTVDAALATTLTTMGKVRDLTVQGGSGAMGPSEREALATEVEGLRDDLLSQANTSFLGRNVFAGTSDAGVAFDASYAFTGSATGTVERRISADTTVRVDSNGKDVFGDGATSVFAQLDELAANLRSGANLDGDLAAIDSRMGKVLTETASVGARHKQVLSAVDAIALRSQTLTEQMSTVQDIDLAATILHLQSQETAYQGALGAAAKVLQPTLLDFLR